MASPESPNTGPKPFVLVLMPFKKEFNDTYTFGIKGAAENVAYAERIDEQAFQEGILDRVFNQINKADRSGHDGAEPERFLRGRVRSRVE